MSDHREGLSGGDGSSDTPVGDAAGGSSDGGGANTAFLPIGLTFLVLGLARGLGDGGGTTFFAVGIAFLAIALTSSGWRRRSSAPPPPSSPPEA
jgi:hypothetical protein